jgi:hypothetical protein
MVRHPSYYASEEKGMTKSRYVAASIAQYLHELSGRHADERREAAERAPLLKIAERPALAGR